MMKPRFSPIIIIIFEQDTLAWVVPSGEWILLDRSNSAIVHNNFRDVFFLPFHIHTHTHKTRKEAALFVWTGHVLGHFLSPEMGRAPVHGRQVMTVGFG